MKKILPEKPAKLSSPRLYWVAVFYAALITLVVVAQLFFYDELSEFAVTHALFGGRLELVYLALSAVMAVFSLPYLLRMSISPLMRYVSWVFAMFLPLVWCMGAIWLVRIAWGYSGWTVAALAVWYAAVFLLIAIGASCVLAYLAQNSIGTPHINQLKKTK